MAALLVLLSPVCLSVAAPRLAPLPAPVPVPTLTPLPDPAPDARSTLDGPADPLPVVVRDLPNPASRLAVVDYDAASLLEPQDAADMFLHAWKGLAGSVPAEAVDAVLGVAGGLSLSTPEEFSPDLGSPEFAAAIDAVLPALAVNPRNADRLNNAAVALFALDLGNGTGPVLTELHGVPLVESFDHLQNAATRLLAEADRAFPPSRAVLLNLGFFTSLRRSPVDDGARPDALRDPSAIFAQAILQVERHLAIDPGDRTARLLLGSLQVR